MATHASYENWSYHNGYGNGYGLGIHGHFMDGVTYPGYYPFYQNQSELNNYETNPFLPSDCSDCIFISGLPKTIQKDEIISIFSKAGKIKFTKYGTFLFITPRGIRAKNFSSNISGTQRIFLFLDRGTKKPTGDATVTYESPESAKNAIKRFDQMNFNGHGIISVKQALPDQKNPFAEKLVSFSRDPRNIFLWKYPSVDSAKRIWLGIHMNYDEIFKRGFNIHTFSLFQILLDVFLPLTLVWATVSPLQKLSPLIQNQMMRPKTNLHISSLL